MKTAKELASILIREFQLDIKFQSVYSRIPQMYNQGKLPSVERVKMSYGGQCYRHLSYDTDGASNREVGSSRPDNALLSTYKFNEIQQRRISMLADRGYFEDHCFHNVSDVVKWLLDEGIARNMEVLYALFGEDFLRGD